MKKKRKSSLGLHTLEEQSQALGIVNGAFDAARQAAGDGDRERVIYLIGFISGIHELAVAEGAHGLANQIRLTLDTLRGL